MKKALSVIMSILTAGIMFSACSNAAVGTAYPPPEDGYIRIVSYNCAAPWGNFLKGTGSGIRVKKFASYIKAVMPDSMGTQEMNQRWLDKLASIMGEYDSYGVKRGGDENENKSEMNAVFWLKDKYNAVDKGTFWLSKTPDTESRYEGAGCHRICTWVVLENKTSGEKYIHMNTHLDNASEEAANYGATVIAERARALKEKYECPIILTGDFNETAGMDGYNTIAEVMQDAQQTAEQTETKTTYQAWGEEDSGVPIDFIFSDKGLPVAQYKVLDDFSDGFISDHYGIMADIDISD